MATNLLLEGDDLEALLIKAHSEGGPNARIMRADKFRHGGIWGFFARERFEVAVEIPEPELPAAGPADEEPLIGHRDIRPTGRRARRNTPAAPAVPLPPPARYSQAQYGQTRYGEQEAEAQLPTPAALAVEGLLGIADRVSAAEHAASRAVRAMLAETDAGTPAGTADHPRTEPSVQSITLPGSDRVRATASTMTLTRPTNGTVSSQMKRAARTPDEPGHDRQEEATFEAIAALAAADLGGVPHEPDLSPVRPSTSRPEFTALLDQLREEARPPRPRSAKVSERAKAYLAEPDDEAPIDEPVARPSQDPTVQLDVAPPIEWSAPVTPAAILASATKPAPVPVALAKPAPVAEPPAELPAERAPEAATEADEDDEAPTNRQSDPRTTADRRALRALGVPAAWTRRLRSGDRFAEVLRMLERMPDSDIDPDAAVVAVVGPADAVRLEAHRTAIDLATPNGPRPVVVVPATVGTERATAVARALRSGPVVLAVETAGDDAGLVLDTLTTVGVGAVIAVVDAAAPLEVTQRWVDALGQVDALALEGATAVPDPAAVLQLGLPVVRLDGVPVDRVTWTALLCAQLMAAESRQAR